MDKDQKIQDWLDGKTDQEPLQDQDLNHYKSLYKNLASHYDVDIPPFLAEKILLRIEAQSSVSNIIKRWLKVSGLAVACGVLAIILGALGMSLVPQQTTNLLPYAGPLFFIIIMFVLVELADQLWVKKQSVL